MSLVITRNTSGTITRTCEVKNLGWLFAHRHDVEAFSITKQDQFTADMVAHLTGGRTYVTHFASSSILVDMLKRSRTWKGLPVTTHDRQHGCTVSWTI